MACNYCVDHICKCSSIMEQIQINNDIITQTLEKELFRLELNYPNFHIYRIKKLKKKLKKIKINLKKKNHG